MTAILSEIDTVLFDLGGVLIDWDPRRLYRKLFVDDPAEMERFLTEICSPLWNHRLDAGRRFDDAIAELVAKHPDQAALITAYRDRWAEMLGGDIGPSVALLQRLREGGRVRLCALTNWSAETFPIAREKYPFLGWFDQIVVSGEEGLAKPDPRLFERSIVKLGLVPETTLFIDDNEANIRQGREFGFHCHHYRDPARLAAQITAFGLL